MTAGHDLTAHLPPAEVLSQMEAAVVVIDRIGSIHYANPYAERLFGVPGPEPSTVRCCSPSRRPAGRAHGSGTRSHCWTG